MNGVLRILLVTICIGTMMTGCASMNETQKGAGIGAGLGAGLGAVAGNNISGMSKSEGAVAGALVGGLLGGVGGRQQGQINRQNQQMASMQEQMNTTTINITNSNGSVTPVVLRKIGHNQWQGPKGEIYNGVPGESQLKGAYGF